MCGIGGAIGLNSARRVSDAIKYLVNRGPDNQEIKNYKMGGLDITVAHARLSIIDLTQNSNQPFESSDGTFTLTFNGEIYNYKELKSDLEKKGYKFTTNGDVEVLLYSWVEWGESALKKLNGMFAFSILNKNTKKIYLVRDAFGIKPLYYLKKKNEFIFGSDIRFVKKCALSNVTLNYQRSYDYLVHGEYDTNEETFYNEILSLEPSTIAEYDITSGDLKKTRWWYPEIQQDSNISYRDAVEQTKQKFLKT